MSNQEDLEIIVTLQNVSELLIPDVNRFLATSPRAEELFRDKNALANWIIERIKIGRYAHPLLFMSYFTETGHYGEVEWTYVMSKLLSNASLSANLVFLIRNSVHTCIFFKTLSGLSLILEHQHLHKWLYNIYDLAKCTDKMEDSGYGDVVGLIEDRQIA